MTSRMDWQAMAFKDTAAHFQMLDVGAIVPDPAHPRQNIEDSSLRSLANSIRRLGLIHPLVVQPAGLDGRHRLVVGERRWRAARLAGETAVPVLVRACDADEALELRVFENFGLGVRAALDPRELAGAIQAIADRFETREAAAEHFGRSPAWLNQATAAANLSPKVAALLESGRIGGTGAAIQLEKLAQKDEARAESLIERIAQGADGERLARKDVEVALTEAGGRRRRKEPATPTVVDASDDTAASVSPVIAGASPVASQSVRAVDDLPPWEDGPAPADVPVRQPAPAARPRVHPGKVRQVAELLGLGDDDEDAILARLIDEFLAMKGATTTR